MAAAKKPVGRKEVANVTRAIPTRNSLARKSKTNHLYISSSRASPSLPSPQDKMTWLNDRLFQELMEDKVAKRQKQNRCYIKAYIKFISNVALQNIPKITDDRDFYARLSPADWTPPEVCLFLVRHDCSIDHATNFFEQEVHGHDLMCLPKDQLVELVDNKLGPAVKIHYLRKQLNACFASPPEDMEQAPKNSLWKASGLGISESFPLPKACKYT